MYLHDGFSRVNGITVHMILGRCVSRWSFRGRFVSDLYRRRLGILSRCRFDGCLIDRSLSRSLVTLRRSGNRGSRCCRLAFLLALFLFSAEEGLEGRAQSFVRFAEIGRDGSVCADGAGIREG
jgi:hypothetical protein